MSRQVKGERAGALLRRLAAPSDPKAGEASEQEVRILKHALASFANRGYTATNVRAVADSARLTAPMINYYFKTKEKLYVRLAQLVLSTLQERVVASLAAPMAFREQLVSVLRAHLAYADESPDALAFIVDLTYGAADGRPDVDVQALYRGTREKIAGLFAAALARGEFAPRTGISCAEAQRAFDGLVSSVMLTAFEARRAGRPAPSDDDLDRALALLFRGVGRYRRRAAAVVRGRVAAS